MDSVIQQIKDRLDIVEVVSSYLKLEKTGINLRACCPFHSEKKPSFFVSPARQSFRCFGCGKSGSIFDFVMEIEGIEFGDALRILAKKAGVELKQYRANPELQTKRARLYDINELACRFFEKQLQQTSIGKKAVEYLKTRGLAQETIEKFRLGFSPNQWRCLSDFLVSRGFLRDEILSAGLTVASDKVDTPYDRFRGRIMFPIFDSQSQVIGFGARVFAEKKEDEQNEVKYINTPATELYDKSNTLYGLNFAKMEIRKKDACILTEGYMDVILSHQAGFENTVSASGTALTPNQLKILKRYTNNLLTAFDMDTAGNTATERSIDLALSEEFNLKIITMSQGKDPADVILEDPSQWQKAVETSKSIMDFYFELAQAKLERDNPQSKKQMADYLLLKIKKLSNKILQAHWIQKLSSSIGIKEDILFEELSKVKLETPLISQAEKQAQKATEYSPEKYQPKTRQNLLEEKIIALAVKSPNLINEIQEPLWQVFSQNTHIILTSLKQNTIIQKIDQPANPGQQGNEQNEKEAIDIQKAMQCLTPQCQSILESCCFLAESQEETAEEIYLCLAELEALNKKNILNNISQAISQAEREQNKEELNKLLAQFNQLIHSKTI